MAGAVPALALNEWQGPGLGLWAAAAVFASGAVWSLGLPRPLPSPRRGAVDDLTALLSRRLLAGGLAMAGSRTAVGFVTFLLAFLLRRAGEGEAGLALVVAAAGAGGLAGSVVAPALRSVLREPALLVATLVAMAAAALWASTGFDLTRAAVVAAAVGLGSGAGRLAFDGLLQHDAPEAVRGRTFARYETIFQLCWVAGAALATVVPFAPRGGMRALAAICAATAVLSLRGLASPRPPRPGRTRPTGPGGPAPPPGRRR